MCTGWGTEHLVWNKGSFGPPEPYQTIARFNFQDFSEHKKGNPAVAMKIFQDSHFAPIGSSKSSQIVKEAGES